MTTKQRHRTVCGLTMICSAGALISALSAATDEKDPQATPPAATPAAQAQPGDPVQTSIEGLNPVKSGSGLKYWDIKVGDGASPKPEDTVTVHYSGWLTDGKLFDSSVKRGKPTTLRLNQFIKGWIEGVGSMKIGGKRRLEIPSELAYGAQGRPSIPPNATLIFEVELLGIVAAPRQTPVEGITPVTTASGLKYWDLKVGDGASPMPSSQVTVHYSGWLTDGTLFDSSVQRGTPTTLALNQFIKGWIEGVGSMKVGGKRRLEIPSDLAYGEKGRTSIPPNSTLIFEVELLKVN